MNAGSAADLLCSLVWSALALDPVVIMTGTEEPPRVRRTPAPATLLQHCKYCSIDKRTH